MTWFCRMRCKSADECEGDYLPRCAKSPWNKALGDGEQPEEESEAPLDTDR